MTTPILYTSITATHWQPALGTPGEVVEGLRDIDQAIHIVLPTPKSSDPHRPEFRGVSGVGVGVGVGRIFDPPAWVMRRRQLRGVVLDDVELFTMVDFQSSSDLEQSPHGNHRKNPICHRSRS